MTDALFLFYSPVRLENRSAARAFRAESRRRLSASALEGHPSTSGTIGEFIEKVKHPIYGSPTNLQMLRAVVSRTRRLRTVKPVLVLSCEH